MTNRLSLRLSDEESPQLGRSYAFRSFEQCYADHLRHLYSRNKISTPDAAIFFWAAGWIDAFTAASSGDAPSYTPEDVENYGLPKDTSTQVLLAATNDFRCEQQGQTCSELQLIETP